MCWKYFFFGRDRVSMCTLTDRIGFVRLCVLKFGFSGFVFESSSYRVWNLNFHGFFIIHSRINDLMWQTGKIKCG